MITILLMELVAASLPLLIRRGVDAVTQGEPLRLVDGMVRFQSDPSSGVRDNQPSARRSTAIACGRRTRHLSHRPRNLRFFFGLPDPDAPVRHVAIRAPRASWSEFCLQHLKRHHSRGLFTPSGVNW
jgi:hypothetical protein